MFNFLKSISFAEDTLEFNLANELDDPPEMLQWRVGCLCIECKTSREESLQKHVLELNMGNAW